MEIFLSYSHKDSIWADALSDILKKEGIKVWRDVDKTEVGDLIGIKISEALTKCTAYCILLTKNSMSSRWVKLELSSALSRWANDPNFKLLPIILDPNYVPSILGGMNSFTGINYTPGEMAKKISGVLLSNGTDNEINSIDWEPLLTAIENDQYTDDSGSHRYGGWSRSYAKNYLPLAFPNSPPGSVSLIDSITVTHWVVKGLFSLQRIIMKSSRNSQLLPRIEKLLALARNYLLRHYDGKGAGLIHQTTVGKSIAKDIRHCITFAKALLYYSHGPREPIRNALNYALLRFNENDGLLPTLAELLHSVGLLLNDPTLRLNSFDLRHLLELRKKLEESLYSRACSQGNQDSTNKLFFPENQEHMAAYYSWWVLDACGNIFLESENTQFRHLVSEISSGIKSLLIPIDDDCAGFPLTLTGSPNLGSTAMYSEALLRFNYPDFIGEVGRIKSYIFRMLSKEKIESYIHHQSLWAVPVFFERLQTMAVVDSQ